MVVFDDAGHYPFNPCLIRGFRIGTCMPIPGTGIYSAGYIHDKVIISGPLRQQDSYIWGRSQRQDGYIGAIKAVISWPSTRT